MRHINNKLFIIIEFIVLPLLIIYTLFISKNIQLTNKLSIVYFGLYLIDYHYSKIQKLLKKVKK
ncbi:hypothetical protein BET04_10280 [Caminicella sporogenes]|nr:hypothetical protein BET04_10280 [Caminicella sporogenes]